MSLAAIGWPFTLGVLAHNTEEALYLPAWSAHAANGIPVGASALHFAAVALSILFVAVTAAASYPRLESVASYLMAGYVLAMALNVFVPHVLATLFSRQYMPGTATATLLNLPLGLLYLQKAVSEQYIQSRVFIGPVLWSFWLSRLCFQHC